MQLVQELCIVSWKFIALTNIQVHYEYLVKKWLIKNPLIGVGFSTTNNYLTKLIFL